MSPGERRRRRFDNPDTWSFNDTAASPPATSWNLLRLVFKFIHNAFSGYVELHKKLRQEGALTPPKAGRLRLATWNVSNLPKDWTGNHPRESMKLKLDNMAAVITLSKSDIVVMQEIKVDSEMWRYENNWKFHPLVLELLSRLREKDPEADWEGETSGPSRYDASNSSHGKAEAYAIFWKRAHVKKELGDDASMRSFVYSTENNPYNADFRELMTWDRSRHHVLFENQQGNNDSARRPAYFYLKGEKGEIVIATLHNASGSATQGARVREQQLEHVDWLLPGQRVDKTKVLFAMMGDFNQKLEDGASTKSYLRDFWAGCDLVGLRRCSSDNLKTAVKNGTHYDDIFVTGEFDAPAACFPTYDDLECWGGWNQFIPAEYNDDDHWAKFKSRVLSDHLLVYADVWPLMPLYDASKEGSIGVVQQWLDRGADVNQADEEGRTPLFVACQNGHVDAARLLLDKGAAVDRAMEDGATPLIIACQEGHVDAARLLLEKGAAVDRAAEGGATPLILACLKGHVDAVRLLLDKGADVNQANRNGLTPLLMASENGHVGAARLLLEKGAAVDRAKGNGWTPLFIACRKGHVDAARLLLDNGAEVDRAEENGVTPLYIACRKGHVDAARLLLDNGAEVDRADRVGDTPLYVARSQGHAAVVALLAEHRN